MTVIQEITSVVNDKSVIGGVLGAVGGYYVARKVGMNEKQTMLMIAGGHFGGHILAKKLFP
jgi:uncharacterized protein YcfJ